MAKADRPDQVRIDVQLERREYVRGVRFYLRKSHLVSWIQILVMLLALAATCVVTLMMERLSILNSFVFALLLIAAVYGSWLYFIKPGQIFDREKGLSQPVTFLFTREDVARQDGEAAALLEWDVKKLWRGAEFYYLFGSQDGYTMLPLRAFGGEAERELFEALALAANPELVFRSFG